MKESESAPRLEGELGRRRPRTGRGRRGGRVRSAGRAKGSMLEQFLRENASSLTFLGVTLGVFISRKFLILPVAIGLMLAQEQLAPAGLERARKLVRS